MKTTLLLRSFLACVLFTSLTAAQGRGQGRPGQEPTGDPRGAMAARPEGAGQLEFALTGLNDTNTPQVTRALKELSFEVHVCQACSVQQLAEGNCPKCQGALEAQATPLFVGAKVEGNKVRLAFAPGAPVTYATIEHALVAHGAAIDPKLFPLTGRVMLNLNGGESDVASVQKALDDSGLFPEARATFDAASGELRASVRCGDGVTLAALQEALGKSTATFADVSWGKSGKGGKAGLKRAGGKGPGKGPGKGNARGKKAEGEDD